METVYLTTNIDRSKYFVEYRDHTGMRYTAVHVDKQGALSHTYMAFDSYDEAVKMYEQVRDWLKHRRNQERILLSEIIP